MIIEYSENGVMIVSCYGVIQGKNMLHYQVAKLLVESSSLVRETQDFNEPPKRVLILENEAEEEYLKLKNEQGT